MVVPQLRWIRMANNLDLESCNIASFSKQNATRFRTTKYHTVLEAEECVILITENHPVGLVFKASSMKKYLMKTAVDTNGGVALQNYISTVIPYTLGDAGSANYVNTVSSYWFNPSAVALIESGETNQLFSYTDGDANTVVYDWYNTTTCSEDYIVFPLVLDEAVTINPALQYTFDIGFLTTDISNIDGIYNASNVIKINEF